MSDEIFQKQICSRYGAPFMASQSDLKVGIALNVKDGVVPINGLRHPPESDTTGWYIWSGDEISNEDDFFKPLHVSHLGDWCPDIVKYLGLAPGWRFLISADYVDVWYDPVLLVESPQ